MAFFGKAYCKPLRFKAVCFIEKNQPMLSVDFLELLLLRVILECESALSLRGTNDEGSKGQPHP